jgi:hypothetical protein
MSERTRSETGARTQLEAGLREALFHNPAVGRRGDERPFSVKVADHLIKSGVVRLAGGAE